MTVYLSQRALAGRICTNWLPTFTFAIVKMGSEFKEKMEEGGFQIVTKKSGSKRNVQGKVRLAKEIGRSLTEGNDPGQGPLFEMLRDAEYTHEDDFFCLLHTNIIF